MTRKPNGATKEQNVVTREPRGLQWPNSPATDSKADGGVPAELVLLAPVRSAEDKQQDVEAKRVNWSTKRSH